MGRWLFDVEVCDAMALLRDAGSRRRLARISGYCARCRRTPLRLTIDKGERRAPGVEHAEVSRREAAGPNCSVRARKELIALTFRVRLNGVVPLSVELVS
jgi:hypothetical protein